MASVRTKGSGRGRAASCQQGVREARVNLYYVVAIWMAMALAASLISIRIAIPVALVEIVVGAVAGNIPGLKEHVIQTPYTTFLASVGSVLLTFLAGAEIDPVSLRRHWKASLSIGFVSFLLPFYAALVETGLNRHDIGKLILAACFVTDLGTVLALGGLFAQYGWLLAVFAVVTVVALAALPRLIRVLIRWAGHRVSEFEIKFLLVVLLALGGLATQAGSKAVLPAYVAGLVVAGVFARDRGSIAALFGLTHGLINERQYTELVTVVLLSAFVPTLIAQLFVKPTVVDVDAEEALRAEDVSVIHHHG